MVRVRMHAATWWGLQLLWKGGGKDIGNVTCADARRQAVQKYGLMHWFSFENCCNSVELQAKN